MGSPARSAFDDLPPDLYGVLVADEVDAARLKLLAEAVGETNCGAVSPSTTSAIPTVNRTYRDC